MEMKAAYDGHPLTVHLQIPRAEIYDLVIVSSHRWSEDLANRPNYHRMIGVPHQVTPERLDALRGPARARYCPDGGKLAAVFVGGSNGAYDYDTDTLNRIVNSVHLLVEQGWKVLLTASPRSDRNTMRTLLSLRGKKVEVWDFTGKNPYFDYLAAADGFLIPKDSVTMPCEALTTGKPVYTLDLTQVPGEKFAKFERFHDEFQNMHRLTRLFEGQLAPYAYQPLNETDRLADLVRDTLSTYQRPTVNAPSKVLCPEARSVPAQLWIGGPDVDGDRAK